MYKTKGFHVVLTVVIGYMGFNMVNNSIWFTRSDSSLEYKNDKKQNFSEIFYCIVICIVLLLLA